MASLTLALLLPSAAAGATHIDEVLNARVEAVASRDEAAFMATIADEADQQFIDRQRNWIRSANAIGIVDYSVRADGDVDIANALGMTSTSIVEVIVSYRIAGFDERPHVLSTWLTFAERNGEWRIASDSDGTAVGLKSDADVMSIAELSAVRSNNFMIMAAPGRETRAREVASLAEQARSELLGRGGLQWNGRMPIALMDSAEQAASVLDTRANTADFVAFVSYRLVPDNERRADAPRLYVQDSNFSVRPRSAQVGTFVHEFTHAALSERTSSITPVWLQEGIAEWFRLGRPAVTVGSPGEGGLPTDAQFAGDQLQTAYREAATAVAFMAGRYGTQAPLRLFDEINERSNQAGTPAYRVDDAFREATGQPMGAFVDQWRGPQTA